MPTLTCDCGKVYTLTDDIVRARAGKPFTCSQCGKSRRLPLPDGEKSGDTSSSLTTPSGHPGQRPSTFVPFQGDAQAVGFECPFCHSRTPPNVLSNTSTAGWVIFGLLLLTCFPVCFLGLLVRDQYHVCASCGIKLA
ncbi:MAG TPA: LITAF-like zinc ribbon domain-containing protein [Planctomycetaceae bacterium]|jgi:predicted RNA-binding Zn-ribbon protein involved in translation (DUF1610 family)